MSYSIMAPFASTEDQNRMLDFLKFNFRPYSTIRGLKDSSRVMPTTRLTYRPIGNAPVIGFNYGGSVTDAEIHYAFIITYFMAIHGGAKLAIQNVNIPYIIYDGCEDWLIYHKKQDVLNTSLEHVITDEMGFSPRSGFFTRKLPKLVQEKISAHNIAVKEEVRRLSRLV